MIEFLYSIFFAILFGVPVLIGFIYLARLSKALFHDDNGGKKGRRIIYISETGRLRLPLES